MLIQQLEKSFSDDCITSVASVSGKNTTSDCYWNNLRVAHVSNDRNLIHEFCLIFRPC